MSRQKLNEETYWQLILDTFAYNGTQMFDHENRQLALEVGFWLQYASLNCFWEENTTEVVFCTGAYL